MDHEIRNLAEWWEEAKAHLRACHEYYCRFNCGTLVQKDVGMAHTPRCRQLVGQYGFPSYPRETAFTAKTLQALKASQPEAPETD